MSSYVWVILKENYEENALNGYTFIPAKTEGYVVKEEEEYVIVFFVGIHRAVRIHKDKVINIVPMGQCSKKYLITRKNLESMRVGLSIISISNQSTGGG